MEQALFPGQSSRLTTLPLITITTILLILSVLSSNAKVDCNVLNPYGHDDCVNVGDFTWPSSDGPVTIECRNISMPDDDDPSYRFTRFSGTFTPIIDSAPVDFIETDNATYAIPIGFSFTFNGQTYENVNANSNGFLSFNLGMSVDVTEVNDLKNTLARPVLAPLWDDLNGTGGEASFVTSGESPNRVFTFQWLNWKWNQGAGDAGISFQVKLYEGTDAIEFVYRQEPGALLNPSASIGLAFQYDNILLSLANAAADAPISNQIETSSIGSKPASGQIYRFIPPPPVFSSTSPATNSIGNSTRVSYNLSGNLSSGSITWTRTSGAIDPASPHVQTLAGNELNFGNHQNITLANDPVLVNGAVYTVSFNGISKNGDQLTEIANANFAFNKNFTTAKADADFNASGGVTENPGIRTIGLYDDGKIAIGGYFNFVSGVTRNRIARLNSDGTLDETFDPGTGADDRVLSLAIQSDGKVIIGGSFQQINSVVRKGVARLNVDGSVDQTFTQGTGPNGDINSVVLQDDGKILIAGTFSQYDGHLVPKLTRLNADGTWDYSFSFQPPFESSFFINKAVLQSDGKILVAIDRLNGQGKMEGTVLRLTADGSNDETFTPPLLIMPNDDATVIAIGLQTDGKILAGGWFAKCNSINQNKVARLNQDGTVDQTFSGSLVFYPYAFHQQNTGKIIAAVSSNNENNLVRLTANGTPDETFSETVVANGNIYALATQDDDQLIIAGDFTAFNGLQRGGIARLDLTPPAAVTINRFLPPSELTKATTVRFHVDFNEPVTEVSANDFVVTTNNVAVGNISVTKQSDVRYRVQLSSVAGNGSLRIDIPTSATIYDLAGNALLDVFENGQTYIFDQVAPDFSSVTPLADAVVTTSHVSYYLSEALASGTITWTRTAGMADPNSPHVLQLAGAELNLGLHSNVVLTNNPDIVLGAVYTVSFAGQDAAGNLAETVVRENVAFKAEQTITFESIPDKILAADAFTVQVSSSSGLPVTITSLSSLVTLDNAQVTINSAGRVTLTATQSGDDLYLPALSVQRSFCITPNKPAVTASLQDDKTTLLTSSASSGNQWYLDGVAIPEATGTTRIADSPGLYTVRATADDCVSEFSGGIFVKANQFITFDAIADKTLGDNSFNVVASASSGLPVTIESSSSKISIVNDRVTMNSSGRVTLTASQPGDLTYAAADVVARTFCIKPNKPTVTASFNDAAAPVLTSSISTGNQWYLDDNLIIEATQSNYVVTAPGSYSVRSSIDDCISESSDTFVVLITSMENSGKTETLAIYPNPVTNEFEVSGATAYSSMNIIDGSGKIYPMAHQQTGDSLVINVEELKEGIYFFRAVNNGKVSFVKFTKR